MRQSIRLALAGALMTALLAGALPTGPQVQRPKAPR